MPSGKLTVCALENEAQKSSYHSRLFAVYRVQGWDRKKAVLNIHTCGLCIADVVGLQAPYLCFPKLSLITFMLVAQLLDLLLHRPGLPSR
jgi:hypothetical protein